ncbi:MAG: DUF4271 domain-containing protein [Winogradskyella sp.]|uniref:DUF4271 domain-containing protein n=1 Tax=Winogradskyella sp. TaxID=1883156 RepID=UPI0017E50EAD|nr:DUF4271 domain-containing protein [Winogradskyella sp.]
MRDFITHNWFTVFTVLSLALIVAAKFVNTFRFNDFLLVVSNSKYLKIYSKDQKFIDVFDSFLFVNLAIGLSIFIYFFYSTLISPLPFNLIDFVKLIFTVSTVIIIKTLLERLIGSLFEIDDLIDNYLFQKTTFRNYSGLILLASNLYLIYVGTHMAIVLSVTVCLICIVNFLGFFSSFKSYQKALIPNFFYFLLYLCALEIGPYVLLYKVIRDYNT